MGNMAPWSSGLRHRPFTAATRVRIPTGSSFFFSLPYGPLAQLVRATGLYPVGPGFESLKAYFLRWPGSSVGESASLSRWRSRVRAPSGSSTFWFELRRCYQVSNAGVAQLAEQLICNQQVAGSSPIASSILWVTEKFHMDGFPSGQREQTVNLPSPTSVVRIHPHPHSAGMAELADALDSGSSEG